ncbi:hypothetical protein ACFPRL_15700 [Pseudoclavibacter helvolus]
MGSVAPSRTKRGRMRSFGWMRTSRTWRRTASLWRRRRGLRLGEIMRSCPSSKVQRRLSCQRPTRAHSGARAPRRARSSAIARRLTAALIKCGDVFLRHGQVLLLCLQHERLERAERLEVDRLGDGHVAAARQPLEAVEQRGH